jgi:hypothetical protein
LLDRQGSSLNVGGRAHGQRDRKLDQGACGRQSPEWRCSVSPATQASNFEYRDGVLGIAKELQRTVKLTRRQEQDPH